MMMSPSVLFTQSLYQEEKEILSSHDINFFEVPMIQTHLVDFVWPDEQVDYLLLTSQNAVASLLNHPRKSETKHIPVFCVGRKTREQLEVAGWKVIRYADYASVLIESFNLLKNKTILFLAGNLRGEELEEYLLKEGIRFQVQVVYKTQLTPRYIEEEYGVVVFFSPSAVLSFAEYNSLQDQWVFCIGRKTASALSQNRKIFLPAFPSRKGTILLCVEKLKQRRRPKENA
ncbi:MAG: uroporphyrinogen-III synthase [Neisseriaceae bacterium]